MSETNAADDYNLEHQFGTAAYRRRCEVREVGSARRALPAGNQVSRRQVSAQAFQASRLRARGAQWTEGLSRRRRPLAPAVRTLTIQSFCGKADCRHVSAVLGERAGLRDPITLHNLYVPAGGDVPDPAVNLKFAHKLAFLDEMRAS